MGIAFFVELEHENLLEFYGFCNYIGHAAINYNKKKPHVKLIGDKNGSKIKSLIPKTYLQVQHKGKSIINELELYW